MDVLRLIEEKRKEKPLHFTLIDPDKQKPEEAAELAVKAKGFGSDAIMVGGSHPAHLLYLGNTIKLIKEKSSLPVILFPSSHSAISPEADAIFFMSLLNSRSPQYLIEEQSKGAMIVRKFGIETLPMAYLIIESGQTTSVEWSGNARAIPRNKPEFALGYALAGKYFGMKFVYLEAGSGAANPVPNEMVSLLKKHLGPDVFLIVGGAIRDAETAKEKVRAGADIIVTGTIAENDTYKFRKIIEAVKA